MDVDEIKYDSKEIQEWCERFNKTQEEYYKIRNECFKMFAGIGNRSC